MKKILFSTLTLVLFSYSFGQSYTGKVGINTNNPQETLHIKSSLRLEHQSQGLAKILRVYQDGSMKWGTTVPNPITGKFDVGLGYTQPADLPNNQYYNASITLTPGKWIVKLSLLISTLNYSGNANEGYLSETYFADTNTNGSSPTTDYMAGSSTLISGTLNTPSRYGMVVGSVLIENTAATPKTYYLHGKTVKYAVGTPTVSFDRFTSNYWAENRIYAIPFE